MISLAERFLGVAPTVRRKRCSKCNRVKPEGHFPRLHGGLRSSCKLCHNAEHQTRRRRAKAAAIVRQRW